MPIALSESAVVEKRLAELGKALAVLHTMHEELAKAIALVRSTVRSRHLILTCGNGGSAAEALHFAEELTGRYRATRPPFRAVCLNADPTALTCIANDFGFDEVFARQLGALATPGDLLVVFSTSGKSPNILRALESAQASGVPSLGLLGAASSPAAALCTHTITVAGVDGAAVQEAHQAILHILCEALEPE